MKIYLGGGHYQSKEMALYKNLFIKNRLFSFYEIDTKKNEWDMIIYLAGECRSNASIDIEEHLTLTCLFNRLFSFSNNTLKLFLAGHCNNKEEIEEEIRERLLTYPLIKEKITDMKLYLGGGEQYSGNKNKRLIFLDSGAYSAFTKGIKINIDEYIEFIKKHEKILTTYSVLDVIGNPEVTQKNQEYMEAQGLKPLPCFHYGESFEYLKAMTKYDYLALGGMVPLALHKTKLIAFLNNCFSIIGKKKVHGFGMTNMTILKLFPFYSVDSTSWLGGSIRGEIYHLTPRGEMKVMSYKDKSKATYKTIGFNDDNDKRWMSRVINNAIEWQKAEKYLTELWSKRGVVWED